MNLCVKLLKYVLKKKKKEEKANFVDYLSSCKLQGSVNRIIRYLFQFEMQSVQNLT